MMRFGRTIDYGTTLEEHKGGGMRPGITIDCGTTLDEYKGGGARYVGGKGELPKKWNPPCCWEVEGIA